MSPRRDGESNQADAGRLRPQLTLPEISLPSGVTDSNPRRGPAFRALPEHLAAIREQFPRLDGVSNQTYARRLLLAHPELTFLEISLLSGVTESNLRRAPAFRALPEHLAAIREQFPRVDGESNGTYARHLLLWRPELTFLEISLLSGVTDSNLRRGPASLPPALIRLRRDLRAPDTPRTAQARSFMDASAPAQGPDSVFDRYRRRLDENDRRADGPDIANEAGPIRRQRLSQDTRSAGEDLAIDLERQQRALSLEIGQWLREGGNEVPGGIADFDQEANARSFARVLNRLLPRARGRDGEELRRQGNAVIKAIASDAALRAEVFTMANNALGSCSDNVAEGFSDIVNAVANHQMAEDVKSGKIGPAELHKWSGQQFRLDALEGAVHRFIRDQKAAILATPEAARTSAQSELLKQLVDEPLEAMLHAKTALKIQLDLPDSVSSLMDHQSCSGLTDGDLHAFKSQVLKQEADPEVVFEYLLGNDTWRTGMKIIYATEFADLRERQENDPFYKLDVPRNDDVVKQFEYNDQARLVLARHKEEEAALLRQLAQRG